MFLCT
jgi:hypothetical protein